MIHDFSVGSLLTVEFDPETKASKIKTNFWDGDWQTIRPVLHSIGDRMLHRFFRGAESLPILLLVEGVTDQRYLAAMATLGDEGEKTPLPLGGVEPIPFGGDTVVKEQALFYHKKRKRKVVAMFDHEPGALEQVADLKKQGFPEDRIVVLENVTGGETDIEDLFAETDYLNAVNAFYGRKLKSARWSNITPAMLKKHRDPEGKGPRITKILSDLFASHAADGWGSFDKTGVCEQLCGIASESKTAISRESKKRFDDLLKRIGHASRSIFPSEEKAK